MLPIPTVSRALTCFSLALTLVHAAENRAPILEDRNLEVDVILLADELRQMLPSSDYLATWLLIDGAFVELQPAVCPFTDQRHNNFLF